MDLVLYTPSGAKINSSVASNNPNINYTNGTIFKSYEIGSPEPGNWTMEITAINVTSTGENYSAITFIETNLFVGAGTNKDLYVPNEPITVAAYVQNNGTPLSKVNVTANISRPDGANSTIQLYDDGLHNDNQSNDGIYANVYTGTNVSGEYYITTTANGIIGNESFERKAFKNVWVEPLLSQPSSGSGGTTGSSGGSSGGGGGGGGGGTSGENYSNIEVKEKYDLFIFKDKLTSYTFNRSNPILLVNITGNINAGETTATVEVLRNTSSRVNYSAPGKVYKNVNIWVGTSGFAVPKNIKEAVITFRVENSWLDSNNLEGSDINMVRWDGSYWSQLETSQTMKDSMYTYYEAKTYAFSPFAIKGFSKAAPATMPSVTTQSGITPTVTVTPVDTGTQAGSSATPSKGTSLINWSIFIVVFAMVGIIIAVHLKRKGNFKK